MTAQRAADANAQRRCGLMFELSVNLERLLEFLASQLPAAFRWASSVAGHRMLGVSHLFKTHLSSQTVHINLLLAGCAVTITRSAIWCRGGSTLNLTRLVELLSFILSHTTGKGTCSEASMCTVGPAAMLLQLQATCRCQVAQQA